MSGLHTAYSPYLRSANQDIRWCYEVVLSGYHKTYLSHKDGLKVDEVETDGLAARAGRTSIKIATDGSNVDKLETGGWAARAGVDGTQTMCGLDADQVKAGGWATRID
eukprot:85227-Chlamydomonas_euryale.AAC.1